MRDIFAHPSALHGEAIAGHDARATTVRAAIDLLKNSLGDGRWELAALLSEARTKSLHLSWGFSDFDQYIDQSNFDIGSRECRYLIRAHDVSLQLGITREQLKAVAISKLKEIFSLDPAKQADAIITLVDDAVTMSLEEVRQSVRELKGTDPETELTWLNINVLRRAKEETILPALAKVKLEYGPTMGSDPNTSEEISDGRALEYLCAEKLAEPDAELQRLQEAADEEGPGDA
jgi:hypothetical protein